MSTDQLERQGIHTLARPSFLKEGDVRGTENIGVNDIKPPSLRIAQSNSPEVKKSEPDKFIKGLTEGMFFNSTTREIYGEGPVQLIIINQLGHRNVEFDPNDKKVVLDFDVPDDDPRCQFTNKVVDGVKVRMKPKATTFYDYLVLVLNGDRHELMTLSLKATQLKKAKDLNTLLAGAKMPSFAMQFAVEPAAEHGKGNSWYGWKFQPAGYVSEALFNEAGALYDKMKGKKIGIENDGEDGEEPDPEKVPF